MLVWIDAHLAPALAPWLHTSFEIEAVPLRSRGLRNAEDRVNFAAARSAGAVLLTKDADFVSLLVQLGPPPQVLWLTCGNAFNAKLRMILTDAWPSVAALLAAGEPLVEISGRAI